MINRVVITARAQREARKAQVQRKLLVIYEVRADGVELVSVEEVNKHDY